MLLIPKAPRLSQILHVMVRHAVGVHVLLPHSLLSRSLVSPYLSVTGLPARPSAVPWHWWPSVSRDVPFTLRVLQMELPLWPRCPTQFTMGQRETCRAEASIGMKGLAVTSADGWVSLKFREGKKKTPPKHPNQVKFWKKPCQTIPVVGTAFSEIQTCYPFISATVLSCFINNRLVLESDKMGNSTVITHGSFCEGCHKNNRVFSLPPKTSSETNSNTLPSVTAGHCSRMT